MLLSRVFPFVRGKTGPAWALLPPAVRTSVRIKPLSGCFFLLRSASLTLRSLIRRGHSPRIVLQLRPFPCQQEPSLMTGGVLKRRRPNRRTCTLRRFADLQRVAALYGPGNPELFPRGVCILLAIERGPPGTTDPRRPHQVTLPSPLYLRSLSYLPTHQEVSAPVASVSFPRDLRSPKPDPPSTKVCSAEPHHLPRALVESPLLVLTTLQELSGRGTPTNQSPGHPAIPSVIQSIHDSTSRETRPLAS